MRLSFFCREFDYVGGAAMLDEAELRTCAREAVQAGRLPNRKPSLIWGGTGFWTNCAVCGRLVNSDELGYELQFAEGTEGKELPGAGEYHVHVRCFTAWDQERRSPTESPAEGNPLPAGSEDGTISCRERPYKSETT
jgi:hypothetical protein